MTDPFHNLTICTETRGGIRGAADGALATSPLYRRSTCSCYDVSASGFILAALLARLCFGANVTCRSGQRPGLGCITVVDHVVPLGPWIILRSLLDHGSSPGPSGDSLVTCSSQLIMSRYARHTHRLQNYRTKLELQNKARIKVLLSFARRRSSQYPKLLGVPGEAGDNHSVCLHGFPLGAADSYNGAALHCTTTLHRYTAPLHCTATLHCYTALLHCTATLPVRCGYCSALTTLLQPL